MNRTDELIGKLVDMLTQLPGIGPKSAHRIVTDILLRKGEFARELAQTLTQATARAHLCPHCHTLTTAQEACAVCSDPQRDQTVICVVESPADQEAIESSVAYRGQYFVLMGRVNPLEDIGPTELGMDLLIQRAKGLDVREIVIATSYTAEGEMTAHLVTQYLKKNLPAVRVSRLSRGLPAGVEVEYTDAATLAAAIAGRR